MRNKITSVIKPIEVILIMTLILCREEENVLRRIRIDLRSLTILTRLSIHTQALRNPRVRLAAFDGVTIFVRGRFKNIPSNFRVIENSN